MNHHFCLTKFLNSMHKGPIFPSILMLTIPPSKLRKIIWWYNICATNFIYIKPNSLFILLKTMVRINKATNARPAVGKFCFHIFICISKFYFLFIYYFETIIPVFKAALKLAVTLRLPLGVHSVSYPINLTYP